MNAVYIQLNTNLGWRHDQQRFIRPTFKSCLNKHQKARSFSEQVQVLNCPLIKGADGKQQDIQYIIK